MKPKKVGILRPAEYLKQTLELLSSAGFEAFGVPFLRIERLDFKPDDFGFEYAIVTSQTAAKIILSTPPLLNRVKKANVISIGPSTAEILERGGVKCRIPDKFDSKTLYEEFVDEVAGRKVAVFRSNKGDPVLLKLAEVAEVVEYALYTIEYEHGREQKEFLKKLASGSPLDFLVFSSRMTVRSFFELAERMGVLDEVRESLKRITVVAIGPPTRDELGKFGIAASVPEEYTFRGVLDLIKAISENRR